MRKPTAALLKCFTTRRVIPNFFRRHIKENLQRFKIFRKWGLCCHTKFAFCPIGSLMSNCRTTRRAYEEQSVQNESEANVCLNRLCANAARSKPAVSHCRFALGSKLTSWMYRGRKDGEESGGGNKLALNTYNDVQSICYYVVTANIWTVVTLTVWDNQKCVHLWCGTEENYEP